VLISAKLPELDVSFPNVADVAVTLPNVADVEDTVSPAIVTPVIVLVELRIGMLPQELATTFTVLTALEAVNV
jgi:hypothetical protein